MSTPCSNTTSNTFQILDPISETPPGVDAKAYLESGYTNLPLNQQVTVIPFTVTKAATWDFVELEVVNVTDATPITFSIEVTAKSLTGFTVRLNGLPDSSSYFCQWTVQVPPS